MSEKTLNFLRFTCPESLSQKTLNFSHFPQSEILILLVWEPVWNDFESFTFFLSVISVQKFPVLHVWNPCLRRLWTFQVFLSEIHVRKYFDFFTFSTIWKPVWKDFELLRFTCLESLLEHTLIFSHFRLSEIPDLPIWEDLEFCTFYLSEIAVRKYLNFLHFYNLKSPLSVVKEFHVGWLVTKNFLEIDWNFQGSSNTFKTILHFHKNKNVKTFHVLTIVLKMVIITLRLTTNFHHEFDKIFSKVWRENVMR